jgi:hypothetical protein
MDISEHWYFSTHLKDRKKDQIKNCEQKQKGESQGEHGEKKIPGQYAKAKIMC